MCVGEYDQLGVGEGKSVGPTNSLLEIPILGSSGSLMRIPARPTPRNHLSLLAPLYTSASPSPLPTTLSTPPFSISQFPARPAAPLTAPLFAADFVQELYLKELKAHKAAPIKDSDAIGQVATFSEPKTPASPEEADLASSLKEYESMAVEVEGQEGADAGKPPAAVEDWLVDEEEDEVANKH